MVEHEALVALDIQSSLVAVGYEVATTVASAAEALEAVEVFHPDLILMDVRLEEGDDGIAAAAAIRARHPTPIVFLTSHSDDATLMRAQQGAQPNGYVLKPYQDRELHAAVEVALQRHTLEQATSQQRLLLAGVLSGISDAVAAVDLEGNLVLVNEAGRRAFGATTTGGVRDDAREHLIFLTDQETPCAADQLPLTRALTGELVRDVELFIRSREEPDGRWYSVNATPLLDAEGLVCGAVAVGRDVTELRAARSELQQLSQTDPLTGAYNRRGFMQVARKALENARQSGRQAAVVFIDLNGMKRINDSLGHPEGDRLLMDITWILRACFRTSDIVGRIGGDEFVVLAPDAGEHADVLPERLRASVDDFNAGSERAYRVSVSIGLCRCDPGESVALEDLVEQADRRMYEDKLIRGALRTVAAAVESGPRLPSSSGDPPAPPQSVRSTRPSRRAGDVVARATRHPPRLPSSGFEHAPASSAPSSKPPSRPTSRWPRAIGATPTPMTPRRLLLVDDEALNLDLFERLLVPLGHELVRAENGKSAIAAFDSCKPDLVLLDLAMSGVNGMGVLAHIREQSVDDHVPVVVLTAHSALEHRLLALEAGADDFLEKPADGRSLRARVTTLLQLKDSRDALRRLNEELELRHSALKLLQREQRDLMAFVVHDLKSPLAAVTSNLGFVQAQMGRDDASVEEALQDAADGSRRLSTMIDDLLILSRLEDSELPLHNEPIQVSDLLREVFGEFVRRAAEKHVKLLTPDLTSSRVVTDRGLLQRVIENLLDNSLRYTPEYGRVHIATRANGKVEIAVSNSGPSIPLLERQRIFEKFARVETHATTCGNAGLGLYFCKRAVEALGGDIEVTETPEWPTSFVVHLPASS